MYLNLSKYILLVTNHTVAIPMPGGGGEGDTVAGPGGPIGRVEV
jgi:hypothetical protein